MGSFFNAVTGEDGGDGMSRDDVLPPKNMQMGTSKARLSIASSPGWAL
jgi:hypothetical protein